MNLGRGESLGKKMVNCLTIVTKDGPNDAANVKNKSNRLEGTQTRS